MVLQRASREDYDSIIAFYDDVIERTPEIEKHARWQHGKHPTADGIKSYVNEGCMYLYKEQDTIVGAMALTMYQGADYHAIGWSRQVQDDEVSVIHILAVSPDKQGTGIGSEMVREAINLAKAKGMKTLAILGRDGGRLAGRADVEIIIKGTDSGRIQEAHQLLMHILLDGVDRRFVPSRG